MRKYLVLLVCMLLMLCGCQKTMRGTDDLIAKAREVIPVAESETIEISYAGLCAEGEKALIWFISGNEYQSHYYLPMECKIVGQNEYVYEHAYKPLNRGTDIAVTLWDGGYSFLVNNPNCAAIRIIDSSGTRDIPIEKDTYPYIFAMEQPSDFEYYFLDAEGKEIP